MNNNQKNRKNKNIIGISSGILLLIVTIFFIILVSLLGVIPDDYLSIGIALISFITLVLEFILLIRKKSSVINGIKIFAYILSILLIGGYSFGIYYLSKTMNFIDNISMMKEEVTNYYVIVLKDSKYQEISDLYGESLAYYENTDREVIDSLKLDLSYTIILDIIELKDKLYNMDVEAILISDIIKNKYDEDYDDFSSKIKVLETISIKNEILDITKKVSIKNTPFNVLISGIDTFGNINTVSRNDVNIIATVNPNTNEILLTSIPRDYYVQLHDKPGNKDKLTHASYYGINTQIQTIEDIFDIDINYYIKVNFSTVIDLVNELGGVTVYADQAVYSIPGCPIYYGNNTLNGACALAFARERYSYLDGDRHRGRNQQEVIKAVFNKLSSGSTLISEYTNILEVLDGKFATNMDINEVLNLVKYEVNDLGNYYFKSIQVDGYGSIGPTYSYPGQDLWIMIPDENTINDAKVTINKVLNDESVKE